MPDQIELFVISGSPFAWRVMLALEIKQLPYQLHVLQASKGEQKKPEYLAVNPRGKVPTLRIGAFILWETNAILAYLDQKYPNPRLFGDMPEQTGFIWRAVLSIDNQIEPLISDEINRPLFRGRAGEMADQIKQAAGVLHEELTSLETELASHDYLIGDQISAADIALLPSIEGLLRACDKEGAAELELGFAPITDAYPAIAAWRERLHGLERFEETVPLHWR